MSALGTQNVPDMLDRNLSDVRYILKNYIFFNIILDISKIPNILGGSLNECLEIHNFPLKRWSCFLFSIK